MALRPGLSALGFALVVAVCGCRSAGSRGAGGSGSSFRDSPRASSASTAGITDLRSEMGPETSEALYERAIAVARTPEEKARAYVSLGRAQLGLGKAQNALKSLYEARRLSYEGSLAAAINLGLGDAYFEISDYSLARRYLSKAADESSTADRDVLFAKLVLCSRAMGDVEAATAYRNKLRQPISEEARALLASETWLSRSYNDASSRRPAVPGRVAPRSTPAVARADDSQDKLRVYSRVSWSARAPRGNIHAMGHVDKITVHHSGGDNIWSSSASDTAEEIRKIQRYHQDDKNWADIGYHYVVDRSGAIWQGRKLRYQGAHARGTANEGNVGIVLLGNYMHQSVTAAQRQGLETLIETLCEHFSVPASRIYTHGEILDGKTDCPGPEITRCVNEIRASLRRRLVAYRP